MNATLLDKSLKIVLFLLLSFALLYYGKPFLAPFFIASLLAMLLLPLCNRLERHMNKNVAVLVSLLVLLVIAGGIVYLFTLQVSDVSSRAAEIQKNLAAKLDQAGRFLSRTFGISARQQQEILRQQENSSSGRLASILTGFFASLGGLLTNLIVVLAYTFLFLLFRTHFQRFVLMLVPKSEQANTKTILHDVRHVSQRYLTGLALMILCLWVMYGIGFTLIGVENALFFAVLCGLLEIVPFVGNLTGVAITILMTLATGGSMGMILGILVAYGIIQFTQTYVLEPLVVGRVISINPVFTIMGIIGGELLWGIAGMILALPLLAIVKIICDHIEPLQPFGFLIGNGQAVRKQPAARKRQ